VLILGLLLLLLGYLTEIGILQTIGIILLVVGAVLWILGAMGRPGWRPSALLVAAWAHHPLIR
jgi:hypothetical protein